MMLYGNEKPYPVKSAFIATVSLIASESGDREIHNSPAWPLIDYFSKRCDRLVVLELCPARKGGVFLSQSVRYQSGRLVERRVLPWILSRPFKIPIGKIQNRLYFRIKIRDILALAWCMLVYRERYELFIGVESLLSIIGGVLKKITIVKKTVYYISDWTVKRYNNAVLNWIYIKLDWLACRWSDFIWNYTYTISEARRNILKYRMDKIGKELWVPFGFIADGVIIPEEKDIDRKRLVYCGGIGHEYGVDLIIESLPLIRKRFPDIKIDILGTGSGIDKIKEKAKDFGVNDCIVWHGYVSDRKKILSYYLKASIALAPYAPLKDSVKRYGDVIKIREAIGCGIPVVTTTVPPSHKEILEKGLGEVIEYTPQSFADAVIKLLSNEGYYFSVRRRVVNASKDNLWGNIYGRTLTAMGYDNKQIY